MKKAKEILRKGESPITSQLNFHSKSFGKKSQVRREKMEGMDWTQGMNEWLAGGGGEQHFVR